MSSIDAYLKLSIEKNARQFVLSPEEKPYLVFDNGKVQFGKEVTASQIQKGVMEIIPAKLKSQFISGNNISWQYSYANHEFQISTHSIQRGIEVIFSDAANSENSADNTKNIQTANTTNNTEQTSKQAVPQATYVPTAPLGEPDNAHDNSLDTNSDNSYTAKDDFTGPNRMDAYLQKILQVGASDLHMCSGCKPLYRVDGELHEDAMEEKLDPQNLINMFFEIALPDSYDDFQETGSCDFAYELGDSARFRVNIFKEYKGVSGAFRLIPSVVPSAELLGLPPVVQMLASLPKGLVVVTGPTGSGKSTTLAAILDLVNRTRNDHILTVEAPIEFLHMNKKCLVHQREVGVHTTGFKDALRDALREDPDVVLIGEMRDLETISTAIETAATGHLVLGTLHTSTAIGTIDRIIDMFPPDQQSQIRMMMSDSLKAVISQTLLKRIGGGRVAALEILFCTNSIANMIRESKTHQIANIMQTSKDFGMQMLGEELARLVKEGTVDAMEAYKKAVDKDDLLRNFKKSGIRLIAPKELDIDSLAQTGTESGRKTL